MRELTDEGGILQSASLPYGSPKVSSGSLHKSFGSSFLGAWLCYLELACLFDCTVSGL